LSSRAARGYLLVAGALIVAAGLLVVLFGEREAPPPASLEPAP